MKQYSIVIAYRYAKRKGGVALHMNVDAEDEERAISQGMASEITGRRNRKFSYAKCTEIVRPPTPDVTP